MRNFQSTFVTTHYKELRTLKKKNESALILGPVYKHVLINKHVIGVKKGCVSYVNKNNMIF